MGNFVYFALLLVLIHACMNDIKGERIGILFIHSLINIWITKHSLTEDTTTLRCGYTLTTNNQ